MVRAMLQTVMHVWESTCRPCWGTGSISSSSRRGGRHTSYVCPTCHGLGEHPQWDVTKAQPCNPQCKLLVMYGASPEGFDLRLAGAVRKTSSRVIPDVHGGNGQFTAGRPAALPEKEEKPDPQARLDRWRSRRKR